MSKNNRFLFSISIIFFFVPLLAFLNKINLPQILLIDVYFILLFQIFFCLLAISISFIFYKIFIKKYLNFFHFFFCNSIIFYLLFFFNDLKSLIYDRQNFYLDEIITVSIYIAIYFLLIYIQKKKLDLLVRFIVIFIILQMVNFSINFYNVQGTINNDEENNLGASHHLNISLLKKNSSNENIFFIVLDGMMSLDSAEKLKIIDSKENIVKSLKKNNMKYNDNFFTNYDQTYLSISSLLQGSYPVTETSKRYTNRRNFFPSSIVNQNKDNEFFKILRKTNKKFYWLGNSWAGCLNNIYINCLKSNQFNKLISKTMLFYYDSIFIYIFNIFLNTDETNSAIDFFNNSSLPLTKNSIFLIHVMSPHPPYFFDKNCKINLETNSLNIKNTEVENYSYAYNCLINIIKKWSSETDDNMIFIFGDHGWSFKEDYMSKNNVDGYENRFKAFFSYKVPSRCKDIKAPNSIVNIMRFALICSGNTELKYLQDLKFKTFTELNPDYGRVFLID